MNAFHFLRPEWLWLLLLLAILAPVLWHLLHKQNAWQNLIAAHLSAHLLTGSSSKSPRWPFWMLLSALIITILAAAGPSWQRIEVPLFNQDRGVVLVLDASLATRAQDLTPDRYTRLNFKAIDVVDNFNEGQLGFIAYAGDAFTVTPLTRDGDTILQSMRILTPEMMPVPGNHPLLAMQEAHRLLSDAGYANGEIIWLTAGIQREDMEELRSFFRTNQHRVSILAAGTRDGSPIRDSNGDLLRDQRGRVIIAQLIPEYLQRIAAETDGVFTQIQTSNQDVEQLLTFPALTSPISEALQSGDEWRDFGPWLLLLLVPLLLIAARRGVVWSLLLAVIILPQPIYAASNNNNRIADDNNAQATSTSVAKLPAWQRPFLTQQQYAQERFSQGDYTQAAMNFRKPLAQGMAWYRAGDYAQAASAFAADPSPEGYYNLGNSLAKLGQLEEALDAYTQALQQRPDWQLAQENFELVKSLLEEQANEQEQGDEGNGDNEGEQHQQGEPDENGDASDAQGQDEQEQNSSVSESPADSDNEQQDTSDNEFDAHEQNAEEQQSRAAELDNLSAEEAAELEQLLRSLDDDPAILLQNRLRLEAQRRRFQAPPRGN
ncbi:tetratricopeptide repeat protein [Aliidiomarina sp.]|uniref:tetratricopeptide repeat protein n=1 Tax=Aliidiomarina sp. TaxID=1872439 RepID=UPI003A4D9F9C